MSRSGYTDECETIHLWRQAVKNAIWGKRGQAFIKEMRDALDAMPDKKLIVDELVASDGAVCALGSVAKQREIDVSDLYVEDVEAVAGTFGIAEALAREIQFENDEVCICKTPEERWAYMRRWCDAHVYKEASAG